MSTPGGTSRRRIANISILFATLAEVLLPFVRNVAMARLLLPHDFGLAITLSVIWGIVEQTTDVGLNFLAIRAPGRFAADRYFATLQGLAIARGVVILSLFVILSPLCAMAFDAPEAMLAYAMLGLAAFLRAFFNLGVREAARHYELWRDAWVNLAMQLTWTIVTVLGALWFRSFYAALAGIIGGAVSYVAVSHWLSPRRWQAGWDREIVSESLAFGRPLIPNGMSNAYTQLADRFVVGATLGVVPLGIYTVVVATAVLPRNAVAKIMNTLYMPVFVNTDGEGARRTLLFETLLLNLALISFGYGVALIAFGPDIIALIFGPSFRPSQTMMDLVAILLCGKFLSQANVAPGLAHGETRLIMLGNLALVACVTAAIGVLLLTRDFETFIAALAAGEVIALLFISRLTINRFAARPTLCWLLIVVPLLLLGALLLLDRVMPMDRGTWLAMVLTCGVAGLVAMVGMAYAAGWRLAALKPLLRVPPRDGTDHTRQEQARQEQARPDTSDT